MSIVFARTLLRFSVALGATLAVAGCAMFSRSDPRLEPAPLTDYPAAVSARVAWSVPVGSGSGYGFAPHAAGESVYAATPSGAVVRVDARTGKVGWQANAGMKLSAGPGSDGTTTAVAASDGRIIAFDEQGREKWTTRASSEVSIPPVVGSGIVVVRSGDYRTQAFDAATGDLRWSVQRPGPALALKTSMQMRLLDGIVITGLPNGRLMAIDAASGNVQWEGTVSVSQGATDLERISDVVGAPQIQGPLLCGVSYQGRVACFDISRGGDLVWSQPFSSSTGLAVDASQAYASDTRSVVTSFALEDGRELWRQNALRNRRLVAPAVAGQAIAVGDLEGYVHFLAPTDGHLLGRVHVGGGAIVSPLLGLEQGVVVQTGNGHLIMVGIN